MLTCISSFHIGDQLQQFNVQALAPTMCCGGFNLWQGRARVPANMAGYHMMINVFFQSQV
ncbi:hypothetical protein M422DRAFT_784666 [Sphaerobolus stellatus SS14]|uniref:Uncharacterized protein n=1 Tax=Sphaerobolus stellatus (strain SS14) TaxID=990650 RepID=A0A0C9TF97_SPHS4|nr:hypothetical protein M422DRAFT_784666 [Sphaerobolus stellatus SS14]